MNTCTHHLGTPGRPCPWACVAVVPAFVAAVAPPTAGHREGVSAGHVHIADRVAQLLERHGLADVPDTVAGLA